MEPQHSTFENGATSPDDETTPAGHTQPDTGSRAAWTRPRDGRLLAGVAQGIANRLELPAWLVRAVFVIAAFGDGVGILAYLVAWAVMPEQGSSSRFVDDARTRLGKVDRPSKVAGLVMIGMGSLLVLGKTGLLGSPLMVALVLAGVGFVLIGQND